MSIELTDRTVRVGHMTKRLRFRDHDITGWTISDGTATGGTWTIREWSRADIAEWIREYRLWKLLRWAWLRRIFGVVHPTGYRVAIIGNNLFGPSAFGIKVPMRLDA